MYVPCSANTLPTNTICVHPENKEEHCPITFIDVIYEPVDYGLSDLEFTLTNGTDSIETLSNGTAQFSVSISEPGNLTYSEDLKFVFNKDTDSLPITRTLIEGSFPCLNSPGFRIPTSGFKTLEVENELYTDCNVNQTNGSEILDDRYRLLNITTTELELQEESGVIAALSNLPAYANIEELMYTR